MDKRDVNTFFKNTAFIKKIDIDRLQYVAKTLITAKPSIDPLQYLWEYNYAIYSVVKAWKLTNQKKRNEDKQQKFDGKPRWMIRIEGKMNTLRKQVSQICEELKRVRENRHLTPKMKKNRSWMITEIKGRITIASLTILKERKINTIRALKRQKEKRKIAHKRFKINQWFDVAEDSFYSHLNNIIKSTELNKHPQFISKEKMPSANQESTSKTTKGDFEEFWRPIWENASEAPIQAEWIKNVESAVKQYIRQPSESIGITEKMVTESIKNKRNWSSPGKDKITNFWIKEMKNFHQDIAIALNKIVTDKLEVPIWLTTGRSVMVPKKVNPSASDYRPITCLNTLYELITSVIDHLLEIHDDKNNLMQIDQRGGKAKSMGCVDNLIIDKMILEDAHFNKKNLSCSWIDVKKAFDAVSHEWITKALEIRGVNADLIHLIKTIMKAWNINLEVTTNKGKEIIGPIKIKRGILQGDSFCVRLFTLTLNPIAWYLRSEEGYKLSHAQDQKITHVLFVDDLKTYHASFRTKSCVRYKQPKEDVHRHWTGMGDKQVRCHTLEERQTKYQQ